MGSCPWHRRSHLVSSHWHGAQWHGSISCAARAPSSDVVLVSSIMALHWPEVESGVEADSIPFLESLPRDEKVVVHNALRAAHEGTCSDAEFHLVRILRRQLIFREDLLDDALEWWRQSEQLHEVAAHVQDLLRSGRSQHALVVLEHGVPHSAAQGARLTTRPAPRGREWCRTAGCNLRATTDASKVHYGWCCGCCMAHDDSWRRYGCKKWGYPGHGHHCTQWLQPAHTASSSTWHGSWQSWAGGAWGSH